MDKDKLGKLKYLSLAQSMVDFYNDKVIKNKKYVEALQSYKWSGYEIINQILLKKVQHDISVQDIIQTVKEEKEKTIDRDKVLINVTKSLLNGIKRNIQTIKLLDTIIYSAPQLIPNSITVYRGMSADIYNDLVCEDKQFYYTSPTYMSTSLSPSVTDNFKGSDGVKYIIHLPSTTKAVFLPWRISESKNFGNVTVDNEFEVLLLRGSKFLVESVSFEPEPIYKQKMLKYKNIPCYDKIPVFTKTYTMRLVSQPSIEELKKNYSKLLKDIKVDLQLWGIKDIRLSDLHPSTSP